jgi:hypothetical protein
MDEEKVWFHEEAAKSKFPQADASWRLARIEFMDAGGAICDIGPTVPKKSGKNKGQPKWAERFKCVISDADVAAEKARYESANGKCFKCYGSGQEWAGWNHIQGNHYKACTRCDSTGKPPTQEIP